MAQFIGIIQGNRGETSKLGSKNSGMLAEARGWGLGGEVQMRYNKEKDRDEVVFSINGGSNGERGVPFIQIVAYRDKDRNLIIEASQTLKDILGV
jgi:hypothetical protein